MNLSPLSAFLAAVVLSTGCVVHDPDGRVASGDVNLAWSFIGQQCADFPDIDSIQVQIPGERLENDGYFPCQSNRYDGVVLYDFAPGRYDFNIYALDASGTSLFESSGQFIIDGNVRVSVDLTPAGGPTSYALVSWLFPDIGGLRSPSCAEAGITDMYLRIDDRDWVSYPCTRGTGDRFIVTPYLDPGTHDVELAGSFGNGSGALTKFHFGGTFQTFTGRPVDVSFTMKWAAPTVEWQLAQGNTPLSCAQANVGTVFVNFQRANGTFLYPGAGDPQPCTDAPIVYYSLPPGTYRVFMEARSGGGLNYFSNDATPPTITVQDQEYQNYAAPLLVSLRP